MIETNDYYMGVDVGGTKTHALIADGHGHVVGFGKGGKGNWESVGLDGLLNALREAIGQALNSAGLRMEQLAASGFGLAGYDWPSQRPILLEAIRPLGFKGPIEMVNDAILGILAGTKEGWGISVVSGTGCNCRGLSRDHRQEGRVVGGAPEWSHEFAGGYDIVHRALQAVTFEWDKRGPATALTGAFLRRTGAVDPQELIEGLYIGKYSIEPGDVMLVFQSAYQADPEALKVLSWAGDQLGQMACGVIRQLNFENEPIEVVLIGSLFDGHPGLTEALRKTVQGTAPQAQPVRLEAPPVVGGVLLAMEQFLGPEAYNYRQALISQAQKLFPKKPK